MSLPLRFGSFTLEPELSIYSTKQDTSYPTSPTSNQSYDSQSYTLETGAYWRQIVAPSMEMYVGGRLGYTRREYSYDYPFSPGSNYSNTTSGYYFGPTLGAEYFFNPHFSLGLDISALLESTTRDRNGGSPYKEDTNEVSYQSRVKLRFYF